MPPDRPVKSCFSPPSTSTASNSTSVTLNDPARSRPSSSTQAQPYVYPCRRVKWGSRIAAIASYTTVKAIIKESCAHFGLGADPNGVDGFVLLGRIDGDELEVSDCSLELFAGRGILTLARIEDKGPTRGREILHPVKLRISKWDRRIVFLDADSNWTFADVAVWLSVKTGVARSHLRLLYDGHRVSEEATLADHGVEDGDTVDVIREAVGRKPVIYLFPPAPLPHASVSVTLVPQWKFTYIYPVVDAKILSNGRQRVTWSVSAGVDGSLVEKHTNRELSYLFWEASSNNTAPPSPPLSPINRAEHFDPAHPSLEPDSPTAVLLPFPDLLAYLDNALKTLTLNTPARTDFITYWLPELSQKPFVALRFLPQAAYERAAELDVTPSPDVVTRVFMLFRPVSLEESGLWSAARERVGKVDWPAVVGVKAEASDARRFRVLEWGAMVV